MNRPSVLHTFALCERSGCGRRCIGTMHNARARRCTSTLHRDDLSQVQSIIGLISRAAPCSRAHAHAPETAPAHAPTPCTDAIKLRLLSRPSLREVRHTLRLICCNGRDAVHDRRHTFDRCGRHNAHSAPISSTLINASSLQLPKIEACIELGDPRLIRKEQCRGNENNDAVGGDQRRL